MKHPILLVLLFCLVAPALPPPASPASVVIDNLQKAWDAAKTYQAKFKQTVTAKRLGTEDESEGTVSLAKPNRLRWVSDTDHTFQILDGKRLTNVRENRRRQITEVDIYPQAGQAMDNKLLNFLAGKAKFKALYKFELVTETPEIATVKFLPKVGDGETLIAEIDKNSYLLRSLTTDSDDNRVRVEFTDIRTNLKLDSKLFEYEPKKTDVVRKM